MRYELNSTDTFNKWLGRLRGATTKQRVLARLSRIENGSFGDFKQIDNRIFELRLFFAAGLRIYYTVNDDRIILLLTGGNKSSQDKDIAKAKQLLDGLE